MLSTIFFLSSAPLISSSSSSSASFFLFFLFGYSISVCKKEFFMLFAAAVFGRPSLLYFSSSLAPLYTYLINLINGSASFD